MKTAWLEAQYNNRALVPDHARFFARWKEHSSQARQRLKGSLDIPYAPGGTVDNLQTLDVFEAPRRGAPVLVFIHGGYWRSLDKSDHSFIAPPLVDAGACVVVPNYALCPQTDGQDVTVADISLQMVQALRWVHAHSAAFGGDPRRVVVVGHSAGGHLAAMLLLAQWKRLDPRTPGGLVKAALSISGLYDLHPLMHVPFLQASLRLTREDAQRCSPALMPRPRQGLLYTVAGGDESDEFKRHNRLIAKAWGARAVPVCEEIPGRHHFSVLDALTEPDHRMHALARELLTRV